jgi:hypothetical protein
MDQTILEPVTHQELGQQLKLFFFDEKFEFIDNIWLLVCLQRTYMQ